ncbi:MAG: hypothetical protein COX81_03595, partial [Candidatus Magasanikbacteria bacterium CG_4_10_14_0_2_um_filter_37_12]
MNILVENPILQTQIFAIIFFITIIFSIRKKKDKSFFSIATTTEMKGFAMLAIVLSHIGYFLSIDTRFMFPLSILAGVGVDLFLFLSGYGLTVSALKKELKPIKFYLKRTSKIFVPLWIILPIFVLMDFFILHKSYPTVDIIQIFFGFVREADLLNNINSPIWFITLILFYYLIFPWFFKKEYPLLSALLMFLIGYFFVTFGFEIIWRVNHLHKLHIMAFPLGIAFAGLYHSPNLIKKWPEKIMAKLSTKPWILNTVKILLTILALVVFLYFSVHSGMDTSPWIQQNISNLTMFALVVLFLV